MNRIVLLLFVITISACKSKIEIKQTDVSNPDSVRVKDFREFKVLDSKYINTSQLWEPFNKDLKTFTEEVYNRLKPLILEQDILTIQKNIQEHKLTYENLTKFYLYRIRKYDRENNLSLNSVISLNPFVIKEAKQKDKALLNRKFKHAIFGMPILLKDNINSLNMPTTAGAVVLQNNTTDDAFIVKQLKSNGALILGKANLSEWAYFFCGDCPSGYSAVGGQTLNPYGRRSIDTGGSSSGSGVTVASNFCAAAVGSETSGSILSPSSANSVVGLKPTIGLLSRSGIVPISSTLDTPGPMTKNVIDNAILLDAMVGFDATDSKSIKIPHTSNYFDDLNESSLSGKRFGAFKRLMQDSLYVSAINKLKSKGALVIVIDEDNMRLPNFLRLLNLDMKNDLPVYLNTWANKSIEVKSVKDVMAYNKKDSLNIMPYGQSLFRGIIADMATDTEFKAIKDTLKTSGRLFFDKPMETYNLDGFLSINNYHAAFAAVAEYPAITVPMGYMKNGTPKGFTFISKPLSEKQLLQWAYAYEQVSKMRKTPSNYN